MKKKFLVLLFVSLFIIGCTKEANEIYTINYIKGKTNLKISSCLIEKDNDTHGGFLGDGDSLVVLDCSNDNEELLKQIESWNPLPLSENLELIMYGGEKDGMNYGYELAEKNGIPRITNGYYSFINRHDDATSSTDEDIFDKYSFNFTIMLYDSDTNKLYYYEFDT